MKKLVFILLFVIASLGRQSYGQNLDSLWKVYYDKSQEDTNRLKAIDKIARSYMRNKTDSAIILAEQELKQANNEGGKQWIAKAFKTLGVAFLYQGNNPKALEYYLKALQAYEEINDKNGIGLCYINIGGVYTNQSDSSRALDCFFKALKIFEKLAYKSRVRECYSNIGGVYLGSSNYSYPKALEYNLKALKIAEEIGDKQGIAECYRIMSVVYLSKSNYSEAIEYYLKELKILEQTRDKEGIANCYANIGAAYAVFSYDKLGNVYDVHGNLPKAIEYTIKALKIRKEIGDKTGISFCYNFMGGLYNELANYRQAIQYYDSSLQISKETKDTWGIASSHEQLANIYSKMGNYKEAYENYVKYKTLNDSIFSVDNYKKLNDISNKFEAEKREVEQAKIDAIALEQKQKQQLIIYAVAGVLFIVIIFSVFLYRRFKITQRQKVIIEQKSGQVQEEKEKVMKYTVVLEEEKQKVEQQKQLIEEKQHEIIDSITYAKRLQQAILPSLSAVKEQLPNSFVYYQPKDIVAGDFYWMHTTKEAVYIVAADCTGHGVPGAMVSVVCSNALNRAVNEFNLTNTGLILDKTRELVIETFEKSDAEVKDGMDISLIRIENIKGEQKQVQWSGANNSLWYISNNELIEVKADKQPIGKYSEAKPFTTNNFTFNAPVTFYLFSDGYADQFSPDDKKLMKKKFKDIVLSIQNLSMAEQKNYLEKYHNDWKANMEQTDDVLVIGVRV
jgi:tetratricopeptide (TPR) repeat protein